MKRQVFVVSEVGTEYNDEIYYVSEGGIPQAIYDTNEEAEAVVRTKTIDYITSISFDIQHWGYEYDENIALDFDAMTIDEKLQFLETEGLSFYRIDAVNYEDQNS